MVKLTRSKIVFCVCLFTILQVAVYAEFTPGNVYVVVSQIEPCDLGGGREGVLNIDPLTGTASEFVKEENGLCVVNGPSFTPDGEYLRLANTGPFLEFSNGWVSQFDENGVGEIVYDEADGIMSPSGVNSTAFNEAGDFFVINAGNSSLLRFPADGGEPTVYADYSDGILGSGSIAFAANGDLYYESASHLDIIRITPDGDGSVFDTPYLDVQCLTSDSKGHIYLSTIETEVYKYVAGDPASLELVSLPVKDASYTPSIVVSSDDLFVYLAVSGSPSEEGGLYKVSTSDGTTSFITSFDVFSSGFLLPRGITVYRGPVVPACPADVNGDGLIDPLDSGYVLARLGCPVNTGDPACDAADVNADAIVDPLDAGFILARFGACE